MKEKEKIKKSKIDLNKFKITDFEIFLYELNDSINGLRRAQLKTLITKKEE